MIDYKQIYSRYEVSFVEDIRAKKHLEEIVNNGLARHLSNFIVKNIDSLPVEKTQETIPVISSTEHRIKINVISNEEIKRLSKIEHRHLSIEEKITELYKLLKQYNYLGRKYHHRALAIEYQIQVLEEVLENRPSVFQECYKEDLAEVKA